MVICSFHWQCDNWHTAFWSELCASRSIASASVCVFWPQIRVRRQMLSRIHCQSASPRLAFWPILHRGPAAAPCVQSIWVWLGYWSTINGCSCGAWSWGGDWDKCIHLHYSICSLCQVGELAECQDWVDVPHQSTSANFRGQASTSVRGSQDFLRICICSRTHPPSAHLWFWCSSVEIWKSRRKKNKLL